MCEDIHAKLKADCNGQALRRRECQLKCLLTLGGIGRGLSKITFALPLGQPESSRSELSSARLARLKFAGI